MIKTFFLLAFFSVWLIHSVQKRQGGTIKPASAIHLGSVAFLPLWGTSHTPPQGKERLPHCPRRLTAAAPSPYPGCCHAFCICSQDLRGCEIDHSSILTPLPAGPRAPSPMTILHTAAESHDVPPWSTVSQGFLFSLKIKCRLLTGASGPHVASSPRCPHCPLSHSGPLLPYTH